MLMVCTGGFCMVRLLGQSTWEASDSAEAPKIGWDCLQLLDICLCVRQLLSWDSGDLGLDLC